MPYSALAFMSVVLFSLVHLGAENMRKWEFSLQARFLSAGGGIAIAYVFIDLLPKLAKSDFLVSQALSGVLPYFERHVYVMALLGFLLFFVVDRNHLFLGKKGSFWLTLSAYALFNFLVGYAVVDKDDPEVQPLVLFTFALALHYFSNDYSLSQSHGEDYQRVGRWLLILSLFLGWLAGIWIRLSPTAIALIGAFIGGGVIMNVMRHELPEDNPNSLGAFLLAALCYTILLLGISSG